MTFVAVTPGSSVTGSPAITGSNGIATVTSWTLSQTAGANTLTATVTGLTGSPVTFTRDRHRRLADADRGQRGQHPVGDGEHRRHHRAVGHRA